MILPVTSDSNHKPLSKATTMTTETSIHESDLNNEAYSATYDLRDNKLRLYCGRVERSTYDHLRKNKWTATPKQGCDFVATWSPKNEDIALAMINENDDIGDEDTSPEERAVDRAERFAGYRDKRRSEAHGHADRYDAGPSAFGNQNHQRASRQAARHERSRNNALSQWSKAEYWQERTAGVIDHALHKLDARTRRGRILTIESDIRRIEAMYTPKANADTYTDEKDGRVYVYCSPGGRGGEWVAVDNLEPRKAVYARTIAHLRMRLAYENAMLGDDGGQASEVEMIPGGFIGNRQIWKINKSPATGRVVSVAFSANGGPRNIERLGADIYRAPTPKELEAFKAASAAQKEARKAEPKGPALINPTPEDAQRLQDIWNAGKPADRQSKIALMTQEAYSARSKGSCGIAETVNVTERGRAFYENYNGIQFAGHTAVCKVRKTSAGTGLYAADRVIVITDKPQKPIPWDAITETGDNPPSRQAAIESLPALNEARRGKAWFRDIDEDARVLWMKAAS